MPAVRAALRRVPAVGAEKHSYQVSRGAMKALDEPTYAHHPFCSGGWAEVSKNGYIRPNATNWLVKRIEDDVYSLAAFVTVCFIFLLERCTPDLYEGW